MTEKWSFCCLIYCERQTLICFDIPLVARFCGYMQRIPLCLWLWPWSETLRQFSVLKAVIQQKSLLWNITTCLGGKLNYAFLIFNFSVSMQFICLRRNPNLPSFKWSRSFQWGKIGWWTSKIYLCWWQIQ